MQEIESYQFSALLNVASSFKFFLNTAERQGVTINLIKQILESPENLWLVFRRVVELSQKEIDPRYENPWDTALTIYLRALSLVNLEVAETAATFVSRAKTCWWATKYANFMLTNKVLGAKTSVEKRKIEFDTVEPENQVIPPSKSKTRVVTYILSKFRRFKRY